MGLPRDAFAYVQELVRREAAIVLPPGKEYLVEARLLPLARDYGAPNVAEYVAGLRRVPDGHQLTLVVEALTTNETSWYRDGEPFTALASTVLPELARARDGERRLRLWSAACSTGQEPYSLAMLATGLLGPDGWTIEVLGSDISTQVLERARRGRYSQLEMSRGMPAAALVEHFTRVGGGDWQISADLRRTVDFRRVNLAVPFPRLPDFDVVFLRNVLIYFDVATRRDVLRRVRSVLRPDGYLVLGSAETTLGVDDSWERVVVGRTSVHRPRREPDGVPHPAVPLPSYPLSRKGA